MIWSIFSLSLLEIMAIFFFAMSDLIQSTSKHFVHKDHQIVSFITFTVITLFFKMTIITSLHQIYASDASTADLLDLNCQVFLSTHMPQVFLVLGLMVILTKALVLLCSIHSTEETFKAEHKKRIKRTDFLLRIT